MTQSKDRQSRTIDVKLAQALPGYVAEESFEAMAAARVRDAEYYRGQLDKQTAEKARAVLAAEESQGEVNSLKVEFNSMKAQRDRLKREVENLTKRLAASIRSGEENARLAELFRLHLDDSAQEMESDNEWEREARQMTWNEIDAEEAKQI